MYFICIILCNVCKDTKFAAVPDPDLEITGEGGVGVAIQTLK